MSSGLSITLHTSENHALRFQPTALQRLVDRNACCGKTSACARPTYGPTRMRLTLAMIALEDWCIHDGVATLDPLNEPKTSQFSIVPRSYHAISRRRRPPHSVRPTGPPKKTYPDRSGPRQSLPETRLINTMPSSDKGSYDHLSQDPSREAIEC